MPISNHSIWLGKERFVLSNVKQILIATMEENNVTIMENVNQDAFWISIVYLVQNVSKETVWIFVMQQINVKKDFIVKLILM